MCRLIYILLFLGSLAGHGIFAQNQEPIITGLNALRDSIYSSRSDSLNQVINSRYTSKLISWLESEKSLKTNWDSIRGIGVNSASDETFRVFTWNLDLYDGGDLYFGLVQIPNKTGKPSVVALTPVPLAAGSQEYKLMDHQKWPSALYYSIIPVKYKRKLYHVALGWAGGELSNKKVVEVISVQGKSVRFGADVFKQSGRNKRRIILEYHPNANVSLKWHPERKQIIFDHLSPPKPELQGAFQYYGPDLSYDALQLIKGKWEYIPDIDIRSDIDAPFNPDVISGEKNIYQPKK